MICSSGAAGAVVDVVANGRSAAADVLFPGLWLLRLMIGWMLEVLPVMYWKRYFSWCHC